MANLTIVVDDDVLLRSDLETFAGDQSTAKRKHIVEHAALVQTVACKVTVSVDDVSE